MAAQSSDRQRSSGATADSRATRLAAVLRRGSTAVSNSSMEGTLTCRSSSKDQIGLASGIASAVDVDLESIDIALEDLLKDKKTLGSVVDRKLTHMKDSNRRYILDPHCRARIVHDIISLVALSLDAFSAPLILAWGLSIEGFLQVLAVLSVIFWSCDLGMNFCTGYYVQGEIEIRPKMVARNYIKSWFMPDIAIILVDAIALASQQGSGESTKQSGSTASLLRFSKVSRFLRLVRMFRIAKVSQIFTHLAEANMFIEVAVDTMKPLMAIIMVNHMLACTWWAISNHLPSDTGLWWVNEQVSSSANLSYSETSWSYQFLTCTHWALMQLTLGTTELAPLNSYERAFNCCSLLIGMFVFSTLISSISARMMQHYLMQKDKVTKLAQLRRFLSTKVSPSIAISAHLQASRVMSKSVGKPMTIKEVAAIALLSKALQRTIKFELCSKHVRHPLLRWWFAIDDNGFKAMCYKAIDFVSLAAEDHLFFPRTDAIGAYVMTSGAAAYCLERDLMRDPHITSSSSFEPVLVQHGQFFCEAGLWCQWTHTGELTATQACELLSISSLGLTQCLDQNIAIKHVILHYAREFHACLTSPLLPHGEEPNDISVPFTEFDMLLPSLSMHCRKLIAVAALQRLGRRRSGASSEVQSGKCCLMINWEGEVERIVSIVALRLSDYDGRVLVQLGEWRQDDIQACCRLPGKKQELAESPAQAFERLLQGVLAPISHAVSCTGYELEETQEVSRRHRMSSKYLRTLHHAELSCSTETLGLEATQMIPRKVFPSIEIPSVVQKSSSARSSVASTGSIDASSIEFYALADEDDNIALVSWLSIDEMNFFATTSGEADLQRMVGNLLLDPAVAAAARERFEAAMAPKDISQTAQVSSACSLAGALGKEFAEAW